MKDMDIKDINIKDLNKKLNPSVLLLALVGLVLVIYLAAGLSPLLNKVKDNSAAKKAAAAQIEVLDEVIAAGDYSEKIEEISNDIKTLSEGAYIDESSVYDDIGEGANEVGVTITGVSFSSSSTSGNYKVYPIAVTASGSSDGLLRFIRYFEENKVGAYTVSNVSLSSGSLSMTLSLYTPA